MGSVLVIILSISNGSSRLSMDNVIPLPYTIPFPLTGERDVSFWRYGIRCFISVI